MGEPQEMMGTGLGCTLAGRGAPSAGFRGQKGSGKGHASGVRSPGPLGPEPEGKCCVSTKPPQRLG